MASVKKALKKVANAGAKAGKKAGRTVDKSTGTILGSDGKSLFFLILSFTCIWLILDMFYGNKLIKQLVDSIFSDSDSSTPKTTDSSTSDAVERNNSTVSGATNNKNFSYQTPEEKRKSELNKQSKNNSTGNSGNQTANFPIHN